MDVSRKTVERTASQAHQAVDRAADRAVPMIDRVAATAHQTVDKVADAAAPAADWINDSASKLKARQERLSNATGAYVNERPFVALGCAFAAGYIIGRLSR